MWSMSFCEHLPSCIYASIWIALIWLFIVPFEVYATINLYRHRYHPGIQARYPSVVICNAILAIFHTLICEQYYYLQSGLNLDILATNYAPFIVRILFPPFLLIIVVMVSYRVYLMHFEINYAVSMSTRDWKLLLSDTVKNNDFYSRNRNTFGNWKWVSKYFIAYIIIGGSIDMIITIFEHPKLFSVAHGLSQLIYIFWLFILILFCAYLFIKTPKFEDAYFVRQELKYLLTLCLFCLVLYVSMIAISDDTSIGKLCNEIQTSAVSIATFGQVIIAEYIILNKIKQCDESGFDYDYAQLRHNNMPINNPTFRNRAGSRATSRARVRTISDVQPRKEIPIYKLFNTLISHPIAINFFVKHLRSEFAIENLLFVIELIQWIYLSIPNKDFHLFDIKPLEQISFELSTAIPLSSANIYNETDGFNWKRSIELIYKKYICSSAEYQVNLPYYIQNGFLNLINLLKIKRQIDDNIYIFKHKQSSPIKQQKRSKRLLFWDNNNKKLNISHLGLGNQMLTISENIAVNHKTINSPINNNTNTMTPLSPINHKTNDMTPVSKIINENNNEKTNNNLAIQMGSFPNHKLIFTSKPSIKSKNKIRFNTAQTFNNERKISHSSIVTLKSNNNQLSISDHDLQLSQNISSTPDIISQNKQQNNISIETNKTNSSGNSYDCNCNNNNNSNDNELSITDSAFNKNSIIFIEYKDNKDPEIKDSSSKENTINVITEMSHTEKILNEIFESELKRESINDKNSVIIPSTPSIRISQSAHLRPTNIKIENSVMLTVKHSFRKLSQLIGGNNNNSNNNSIIDKNENDNINCEIIENKKEKENELYLKELKQYEEAKNLNINQFISIVCQSLHIILQLNYQSISRFKRSEHYSQLIDVLNMEQLIQKHGNKGCVRV